MNANGFYFHVKKVENRKLVIEVTIKIDKLCLLLQAFTKAENHTDFFLLFND